jgi:ribonuclease P protein component
VALPKANRLKSRRDFQSVFQKGLRRHGSYFTLRALRPAKTLSLPLDTATEFVKTSAVKTSVGKTSNLPLAKATLFGITVSTKVSKKAVVRNRIKRQIATALYHLLPKLLPGWRIVVVVKPTAAECKCGTQQFLQELEQLLAEAEVFNGHT